MLLGLMTDAITNNYALAREYTNQHISILDMKEQITDILLKEP